MSSFRIVSDADKSLVPFLFATFFPLQRDPEATTAAAVVDLEAAETFSKVSQMKSNF